jgi:hypothetical protein
MIRICEDAYELYCQGRYYGRIQIENIPDQPKAANFHIYITKFSHNILNRMRRDEESLMKYIRDSGYDELLSCVDIVTVKHGDIVLWTKFVKLFEFDEPKLFARRTI